MRTTVVTGLLGSGKTTFIRNFLDGRTEKTVVLVNDFGQAGIDGEIISAGGIETIELPSGCVCCTLKPDLISSIRRVVAEHGPEHLVIEPSGVASPSGVLDALGSAGVGPAAVIGIVDAAEFADLYRSGMYGNFFREQIELSDTILLNKTDIATDDQIEAAETLIADINPGAALFRTVNARIEPSLPIGERLVHEGRSRGTEVRGDISMQRGHCRFDSLSFTLPGGTELGRVRALFDALASGRCGAVVRAKALVATDEGPYRFDLTFGKVDVARFDKEITDSRLVVIGSGLDSEALKKALSGLA